MITEILPVPPIDSDRGTHRSPRIRVDPALAMGWASALVLAVGFATLSLQRHAQLLTTGYDLGIFEQEVRSYSEGRLPTSLLKGVDYSLLGDHFSPIVATLAPLYLVFPGPGLLLAAQAVLIAVGVVPLTIWAVRSLGRRTGIVVALSYGLAGGLAHAVGFDFHEIAFAVPLLSFSVTALGRRRFVSAALWAAPLVLVKEDLGLTVTVIGVLIACLAGRSDPLGRRTGLVTAGFGVAATAIESFIVIPLFNPSGENSYTGQVAPGSALAQLATLLTNDTKIATVVVLLLPTAFIALRSPIVLIVVPTLAWRFLSDNPNYWGTAFHYDAVLVPIVTAAFIDGLLRLRRRPGWNAARHRVVVLASLTATVALLAGSPLMQVISPGLWQRSAHVTAAKDVLSEIPDGATVAASNSLAPQLTDRAEVSLLGILPIEAGRPEYIVADTSIRNQWPVGADGLRVLLTAAAHSGYRLVADDDGVVLLSRDDAGVQLPESSTE